MRHAPRRAAVAAIAAAVAACAAGSKAPAQAPAAAPAEAPTAATPPGALPGDPRAEIAALERQIDADLATLGLAPAAAPACASRGCPQAPEALALPARADDPTCRPPATERCTDACTLPDSICGNAARICDLAGQLGGADGFANERCARGQDSCTRARARCCGCS